MHVAPRARRTEIAGRHGDAIRVRIAAAPVDGAANAELIKLLAKKFDVAKSDIAIASGETSRNKRIRINNLSQSRLDEVTK